MDANVQRNLTDNLWANRFFSYPVDGRHLWRAVRSIDVNPVRAELVTRAEDRPWSSVWSHVWEKDDPLRSPTGPLAL